MNQDEFEDWYVTISDDEAEYALKIMEKARAEILTKMEEIFDE